jgi:16S rRNA (guanine527-N7)-methyltransferase
LKNGQDHHIPLMTGGDPVEIIKKYFSRLSALQLGQFEALKDLYASWNEKINVISRKDMGNFYEHHVLHSLAIAARFDLPGGLEVLDLGCGGGFPGIPLAIFFPDVHFHLVDSINKKLKVVAEVARHIGLNNVSTQHSRAEDIRNRKFDAVVSRAVAPLKDLWQWSKPLLRRTGSPGTNLAVPNGLVCLKGGDLALEIAESGCKPQILELYQIFARDHFHDKYLLYVPLK